LKTEEGVINLALVMFGDGEELKRLMNMKLEFPNDALSLSLCLTAHVSDKKRR
jgi:hypothetical protein